jgi:hypothetical protein
MLLDLAQEASYREGITACMSGTRMLLEPENSLTLAGILVESIPSNLASVIHVVPMLLGAVAGRYCIATKARGRLLNSPPSRLPACSSPLVNAELRIHHETRISRSSNGSSRSRRSILGQGSASLNAYCCPSYSYLLWHLGLSGSRACNGH